VHELRSVTNYVLSTESYKACDAYDETTEADDDDEPEGERLPSDVLSKRKRQKRKHEDFVAFSESK